MNQDEMNPGRVRKDLYAYLESEGFKVTDERHKAIKTAIVMHTNTTVAQLQKERENAVNALQNMKQVPKFQTMIDRMKKKQCTICGLALKKEGEFEYSAPCGHFPKGVRILLA